MSSDGPAGVCSCVNIKYLWSTAARRTACDAARRTEYLRDIQLLSRRSHRAKRSMMSLSMTYLWLIILLGSLCLADSCRSISAAQAQLGQQLSSHASILDGDLAPGRWSEFGGPRAQIVVNVGTEEDVANTIRYCNQEGIPFVAQNGGNGWADTFDLGTCGVIINLAQLNRIIFNHDVTRATIQGGVLVQDMISTAYTNNTRIAVTTCPCLGFLGASLGGGLTRITGSYGWTVDQIESFNIVLASGEIASVTNDSDLFWAVSGAGPNFGIVTSAVIKAYPTPMDQNLAWQGPVTFSEDKLEDLVATINNLDLGPKMQIDLLLSTNGPPSYTPGITAIPFYLGGNASEAEAAFAPIFDLGPLTKNTTVQPYSDWDNWAEPFCTKGGRKPTFGASSTRVDPTAFRAAYDEFKTFVARHGPDVGFTSILVEIYGTQTGLAIGDAASSYPWRALSHHTVVIPWYTDAGFDPVANAWGEKVRDLLRRDNGVDTNSTYINFAHGDESLEDVYGQSLTRLRELKAKYDPHNRFNQWFSLA